VRGDEIKNHIAFTAKLKSKSPYRMNYQAKQALVLLISSLTVTTESNFGEVHCVYKEIYIVLSHMVYSCILFGHGIAVRRSKDSDVTIPCISLNFHRNTDKFK
jgi:drug/metabolite transporter superfamily protein YnfA